MSSKSSIITPKDSKDARLMLLRQGLSVPIRFLKNIIVLPLLTPDLIFVIKLASTWLGYTVRANLGTFNLLGLYFPVTEAEGDIELGQKYKYQAWLFSLICLFLAIVVAYFIAVNYFAYHQIPLLITLGVGTVMVSYMMNYYQAVGNFTKIAIVDILSLVVGFIASLGGLLLFGFDGYLIGLVFPFLFILFIGKDCYFPKKIALSSQFIKKSIFEGGYLTIDGFLASFVKAHEITFFAFLVTVDKSFAGQYAVAISLASIQDSFITSVSKVYQRRVTKNLSTTEVSEKYKLIYNFALLDTLLFGLMSAVFLIGGLMFQYIFPNYSQVTYILPGLMLGVAVQRGRYYPGLVFKLAKEFNVNIIGHVVHLLISMSVFFAIIYIQGQPTYIISMNQIAGTLIGLAFIWGIFFYKKDKVEYGDFILKYAVLFLLIFIQFAVYMILLSLSITGCIITTIIGLILILAYSRIFIRDAFDLMIQILYFATRKTKTE